MKKPRILASVCIVALLAGCANTGAPPDRTGAAATGAFTGASLAYAVNQPLFIPLTAAIGGIIGWWVGGDEPPPPECTFKERIETDAQVYDNKEKPQGGNHYRLIECSRPIDRHNAEMPPITPITAEPARGQSSTTTDEAVGGDDSIAWHEQMAAKREAEKANAGGGAQQAYDETYDRLTKRYRPRRR